MYSPIIKAGIRRLGRLLVYELFQLALWVVLGLRKLAGLRSAWHAGAREDRGRSSKAIRPRRPPMFRGYGLETPARI